jgi:hypothetical protein
MREKKKKETITNKKSSIIFHHTPHQEKIDIVVLSSFQQHGEMAR